MRRSASATLSHTGGVSADSGYIANRTLRPSTVTLSNAKWPRNAGESTRS